VDATRAPIAGGLELTNFGSSTAAAASAASATNTTSSSSVPSTSGGVEVLRGEQHTARVIWRPRKPGKLRETLHFKLDGKWPLQVVVTGEALAAGSAAGRRGSSARGRAAAVSSRAAPLQLYGYGGDPTDAAATAILGKRRALSPDGKENAAADAAARRAHMLKWSAEATKGLRLSATSVNTAANTSINSSKNQLDVTGEVEGGAQQPARKKAKGLAGSSVNTSGSGASGSSAKTALLRKSLHDKRWAEKQAESFTAWLNFALLPKAEWGGSSDDDTAMSSVSNSVSNSSSTSAVSQSMFSKVQAARGEARARQRAMLLYRSPELSGMRAAVADKV
jgi:hypothetical protein